jgi:transposase
MARYIIDLLQFMTIEDVAKNLCMHWNTVKVIEKERLRRKYKRIDLSEVTKIAIDEFAVRKGHDYQTVVMDLSRGRIIYVGEGRSSECLDKFWKMLEQQNVQLSAIAMDMWPAYINSAMNNAPGVPIVFDKFHIVKKLNEAIDDTRKALYAMETDLNKKKLIKGLRWLLLKRNYNLNESGKERLNRALETNMPLAEVYYLKEEINQLWEQPDEKEAMAFINLWCKSAEATGLTTLRKFSAMLKSHCSGILNWFKHPISTGPLEGMNNKIKVLKRKAYGYRDMEFFNLKILDLHRSRYAFVG